MTAVITEDAAPRSWLVALKDRAARQDRPRDKPAGRWLGDFLTEDTPNGLLKTELSLLDACANGDACVPSVEPPAQPADPAARRAAVEPNRVRAGFLRFLVLGGDVSAPIHEAGVELNNALIDGKIDLRGGKCVGRLLLINCVVLGELSIEDATLGMLVLRGSHVAGISGNRAKISGTVFLDEGFAAEGGVSLFSAKIDGSLVCGSATFNGAFTCASAKIGAYLGGESATFAHGIAAEGVVIGGDARLGSLRSQGPVSLIGADIGGSLKCSGATFRMEHAAAGTIMLDVSRAKIKGDVYLDSPAKETRFVTEGTVRLVSSRIGGDVYFWGSSITATGADDRHAVDAQNAKVEGSVYFGGGFEANGLVSFSGADIAKDLDFSDGAFHNEAGIAILADRAKVSGVLKFQTTAQTKDAPGFQSFGEVFLAGAECGELNCYGGTFDNQEAVALNCTTINVAGSVYLRNAGIRPFQARGVVRFHTARVGQHFDCGGGQFFNPQGEALNCEAATIAGCVFLNGCDSTGVDRKDQLDKAFKADGKVTFVGASIGLQFNCQSGRFRNATPDRSNDAYAGAALDMSTARIGDSLFLGMEDQKAADGSDAAPATIEGALDLTGATIRLLVDEGVVGAGQRGLRPFVTGRDGRQLRCNLKLDQFSYERLKGNGACKADLRLEWLRRQPPEALGLAFQPQPFEQLVKVMRAMGHDDEADEIALSKRTYARRVGPWWSSSRGPQPLLTFLAKLGELVFVAWFLGYGYKISRALVILLVLGVGFGWFYGLAFQQGAIVPADKAIRGDPHAAACVNWEPSACPALAGRTIPLFNPWLYSADVMIPVIGFGQKAAWTPTHDRSVALPFLGPQLGSASLVYAMQLIETVLGWIGGILLLSFVSGLIAKE